MAKGKYGEPFEPVLDVDEDGEPFLEGFRDASGCPLHCDWNMRDGFRWMTCVNALDGIDSPKEWMDAVREVGDAARHTLVGCEEGDLDNPGWMTTYVPLGAMRRMADALAKLEAAGGVPKEDES